MPMGLNISPSIWQSYINVILDCLQSRKYCEVTFAVYPIKGNTHEQIRRPIESFIEEWFEDITKEVSIV